MEWVGDFLDLLGVPYPSWLVPAVTIATIAIPIPFALLFLHTARPRFYTIAQYNERVVVLGASSGTGRAIALAYARRGCTNLVLVGRRKEALEKVRDECFVEKQKGEEWDQSAEAPGWEERKANPKIIVVDADCSNVDDVEHLRDVVKEKLGGVDTLHICFGLSALRPLLGIAGVDPIRRTPMSFSSDKVASTSPHPTSQGLAAVQKAAQSIYHVNASATAVCLAAFLPLLQLTSLLPSVVLLSSAAAIFPAPTRALYGSSKAAQLLLFKGVALESDSHHAAAVKKASPGTIPKRAKATFCAVLPGTIMSSFRESAVDGDPATSGVFDSSWSAGEGGSGGGKPSDGLTPEEVAATCIDSADNRIHGDVLMPRKYALARWAAMIAPGRIAAMAHKKYAY